MMFFFLLKVHLNVYFDDIVVRFSVNKGTVSSQKPLSFTCTSKLNFIVICNVAILNLFFNEYFTSD